MDGANVAKCQNCYLRYHCDEQTEFICRSNDYCKYVYKEETINYEKLTLVKTVRVTDPWCWYNKDTVEVILWVTPYFDNKVRVQVSVHSIDDFSVNRYIVCEKKYDTAIQAYYDHFKEYLFDRMPNEISLDWLYEHGYLPD